jgi:ribosomal protein S18 acetylase RimI-like enzyme
MGATEPPLSVLGPADIAHAQALVVEAGWNQVPADWRLFVELGRLYGLRAADGGLLATAATLPLSSRLSWISMVIVTGAARHRGLASRLVLRCIADLTAQGLTPGLDATPAGRAVYGQLGFRDGWPILRMARAPRPRTRAAAPELPVRAAVASDLDAMVALDARAFGAARRALLARLFERAPDAALVAGDGAPRGFLLARDGRQATQLGPIVGATGADALALLDRALERTPGPVFVDVVETDAARRAALEARGFVAQRPFTRMFHGTSGAWGDATCAFAIAGPELG